MNRRRFLKFLGLAPAIPAVLKGIDWEQSAEAAVEPTLEEMTGVHPVQQGPVPAGSIYPYVGEAPQGWLPCDGRLVSVDEYPTLYKAIGQAYGVDGSTHRFRLPHMNPSPMVVPSNGNHSHGMVEPNSYVTGHANTFAKADHNHNITVVYPPPIRYLIKT